MDELISVIINVYNGEKYIRKCLESIINQTYKNLEILIINDGSTDNTLKICEEYKDERIKIINQENKGLALARNVGIDNAKGEYLYFIDSDDYVDTDIIEYLYKICKQNKTLISTCNPIKIYDYNFEIKNVKEKVNVISGIEMLKKILLSQDNAGTLWNKLMKKEVFDKIRFEDRIINDVVVVYKLMINTKEIAYSNQIKYYYLQHSESILGQKRPEYFIDWYKGSIERYENIKKLYPKLIENEICVDYVIMILYLQGNEKVEKFLKEQNAIDLYKKLFSVKMLFSKLKGNEKIKMLLFRINPKFLKSIIEKYLKIKQKLKKVDNRMVMNK